MEENLARSLEPISLPPPAFERGQTLFQALKDRRTGRSISDRVVPLQVLGDILWAAQGVNRAHGPFGKPGRTAASASNSQEICMYVVREDGAYLYEPDSHELSPIVAGDLRGLAIGPRQLAAGSRATGARAQIRLIYVADLEKFKTAGFPEPGLFDPEIQKSYYFVDTGLIAQNVYLAASASGLASWFHNCDRVELARQLGLKPHQLALFGQTIGYTAE